MAHDRQKAGGEDKGRLPATRRIPVVETLHGETIIDPYRWLEDGQDAKVKDWTAAQNAFTRSILDARPERAALHRRLAALMQAGYVLPPIHAGDRYFFSSRGGDQEQAVLSVREGGLHGRDRLLLDPASGGDATTAIDWTYPSPDGSLLAYGLSNGGDEQSTLRIRDVVTGQDHHDVISRTRACNVAWLPDASGFYYTRYPLSGTVPDGEEMYHRSVYLHVLGSDPTLDILIYADSDPRAWPSVDLSHDGRFLVVACTYGWDLVHVYWQDLQDKDHENDFTKLTDGLDNCFEVALSGDALFLLTDWQAPRGRVLSAPLAAPFRPAWRTVIPEGAHAAQSLAAVGHTLVVGTLENAVSHLRRYDRDGLPIDEIALPALGTVYGPMSNEEGETLFSFTSFAHPLTAYHCTEQSAAPVEFRRPAGAPDIDPASVAVRQLWYDSLDGTPISMFVVHRAGLTLDGARPTILTGYGGFNVSRTPEFGSGALHAWIENGGVYALPNLRGGGEYGREWHQAGMLERKQNVFDDFAAAARCLIDEGYTVPAKLACWGGSNGGLLVGAAITGRPELFAAAVCSVPLLDMLRYHLFLIARLWIPEYGVSEDPEAFRWLRAYSPYHHVDPDTAYPAVLFTAAEEDSRVDPLHARKMAALLQETLDDAAWETRPVLLRVEAQAGHGVGKPVRKQIDEQVDLWTFVAWRLGLPIA